MISGAAMSVAFGPFSSLNAYGLFAVPGRGVFELGSTQFDESPCADGRIVGVLGYHLYSAWTSCGLFTVFGGATTGGVGVPAGTEVTAMLEGLVGTSNAGVFSLSVGSTGGTLTPSNDGLPANASVRGFGLAAERTYVSLSAGGLYDRGTGSKWEYAATGFPAGTVVAAVGGRAVPYAALEQFGLWRREPSGHWRRDSNGAASAGVVSLASWFAAAGTRGVLRHTDGGWIPETSGLPPGADARVLASVPVGGNLQLSGTELYLGTGGQGLFGAFANGQLRLLPAVVDTFAATGQRLQTELTIGYAGAGFTQIPLSLPSTSTSAVTYLHSDGELRTSDPFGWFRSQGLAVPPGTPVASVMATWPLAGSAEDVYMLARVYTTDPAGGTYGVMLDAPTDIDAAEDEANVYGLRSAAGLDRSNLAVVHMPGRGPDPIALSVQVFSSEGVPAPNVLTHTLAPGEFFQWNDVLLRAGLPQGSSGYARISRTAGIGAWTGYGVVNDAATSDGAVLPLYRPGGLAAARRLLVPVVLDAYGAADSHYTTELTLVDDSSQPSTVSLLYHAAAGYGGPLAAPAVTLPVGAGRQVTLQDVVAYLRSNGVAIPDPLVGRVSRPELSRSPSMASRVTMQHGPWRWHERRRRIRTTAPVAASESDTPRSRGAAGRRVRRWSRL